MSKLKVPLSQWMTEVKNDGHTIPNMPKLPRIWKKVMYILTNCDPSFFCHQALQAFSLLQIHLNQATTVSTILEHPADSLMASALSPRASS